MGIGGTETAKGDDNTVVRPVDSADLRELYEIVRHPEVARNMVGLPSVEFSETEQWFRNRQPGHHRLVAEQDSRVVGSIFLTEVQRPRMHHVARLGMMVHPDYWNQGAGSALVEAVIDLADNWLNVRRLELGVLAHNQSARRLYERYGFELEGIRRDGVFGDGDYQDELIMARTHNMPPRVELKDGPRFTRRQDVVSITTRPIRVEDAPDLHAIAIHPAVARGTLQMPSMELVEVERRTEEEGPGRFRYTAVVQHLDGSRKIVGNAGLHRDLNPRLAHCAGIGINVHPDYWGIGVGSQLMKTLLDLADHWLALHRVELEVLTDNSAAIRLYERLGFIKEGTRRGQSYGDGRWSDAHFMARVSAIDSPQTIVTKRLNQF